MSEDQNAVGKPEERDSLDLPPAAQWMLAQAEAARREAQARARPGLSFTPLAQRERRVVSGLRGNRRLTAGLDEATTAAVHDWAAALGGHIVAATAGLDDATAEPILQERVRAARALLRAAGRAAADSGSRPARLSEIAPQLTVLYYGAYSPRRAAAAPLLAEWAALGGQPAARIAALRTFIASLTTEAGEDGT